MHIAAEEVVSHRERSMQKTKDEQVLVAALEHGIYERDPKMARVAYAAACRAQQEVHASATGCSIRLRKLETLLNTRYQSIRTDVMARFPLPDLEAACRLIRDFATATKPHGRWADVKFAKSELSLTIPGHTFIWWTLLPTYRGKWTDMHELAICWRLTAANDLDTFQRSVRRLKPKPDSEGRTYILRCPPWALV